MGCVKMITGHARDTSWVVFTATNLDWGLITRQMWWGEGANCLLTLSLSHGVKWVESHLDGRSATRGESAGHTSSLPPPIIATSDWLVREVWTEAPGHGEYHSVGLIIVRDMGSGVTAEHTDTTATFIKTHHATFTLIFLLRVSGPSFPCRQRGQSHVRMWDVS